MNTINSNVVPLKIVRNPSASKFVFETIPEKMPRLSSGFRLIVTVSTRMCDEAREIRDQSEYTELIEQAKQPGSYFEITGFYSVPEIDAYSDERGARECVLHSQRPSRSQKKG